MYHFCGVGASTPFVGKLRTTAPDQRHAESLGVQWSAGLLQTNRLRRGLGAARAIVICLFAIGVVIGDGRVAICQDAGTETELAYRPAIELLPETVAGLIRIPNLPKFCEAIKETHIGKLLDEESMQPFIEAQRARARNYLESVNNKVGLRPEDLYDIASGEVVFSWLPHPNDKRRPFSFCVVADVRGRRAEADKTLETLDKDLAAGNWERVDVTHRDQQVRIYTTKPKPGQLKVEQIAIALGDSRIIAADRDTVVTNFLDALAGAAAKPAIATHQDFRDILSRSGESIQGPISKGGGTLAAEWFAEPFAMGRILREAFEVDRGNQIDILKLLENQGFSGIRAVGGVVAIAGKEFDVLQKGHILATRPLQKAARLLAFEEIPLGEIPKWVGNKTASFNRLRTKIEEAFWASGSLVDEALDDEIFEEIMDGIRDDKEGPQIDIKREVLPSLDNELLLVTDNTVPAGVDSERLLVAIKVRDAVKVKANIRKWMEVEPELRELLALPEVEIWRVEQGEGDDELGEDIFDDLDLNLGDDEVEDEPPPLLAEWAIALIEKGPGSDTPYLMFSSHPELLIETAKRIMNDKDGGFASAPDIQKVVESMENLECNNPIFDRVVRTKLSLRVKYELLRQGKLKDSDSVLAKMLRRLVEEKDGGQTDPLNAQKLPPLEAIEEFLPDGGSYVETTEEGWATTGFLLKK